MMILLMICLWRQKDVIELILNNPSEGEEATDILMIAKYFERIEIMLQI